MSGIKAYWTTVTSLLGAGNQRAGTPLDQQRVASLVRLLSLRDTGHVRGIVQQGVSGAVGIE